MNTFSKISDPTLF